MTDLSAFADMFALPAPPAGWFDYGFAALADGRLALIRTRRDVDREYRQALEALRNGEFASRMPDLWKDKIRLSVFDGADETDVVIVPPGHYPEVDRWRDGRWLVASSRAAAHERNGCIYAADGRKLAAIALGDGIENLLAASDGTFWVGYFDEGVFGGAISSGGIVQFDAAGKVLWSFNSTAARHLVDDAYAMTLAGNALWACFYSDFPIARVERGKPVFWSNAIVGARAIAVEGDVVMLAGGYEEENCRAAILKLERETSRQIGSFRLPPAERGGATLLKGRGNVLHVVRDGIWMRTTVRRALEAASSGR
ncbi:hypothetical protein ACQKOH_04200 [Sphingomonas sp. NPDC092331]